MRTERYIINLKNGLIGGTAEEETQLLKSFVLDFFKMKRDDAEIAFGKKARSEYIKHIEFTYFERTYARLTEDDIIFRREDDDTVKMIIYWNDEYPVSTPSGIEYALTCMLQKMVDESVSVEHIHPEYELVMLGPQKQPDYYHGTDWYDEDCERVTQYHITNSFNGVSNYRVGDGFVRGSHLEVYGVHLFYDESEIDDYLQDNYPDAKEYC